jgi:hypothetical protein
MLSLLLALTCAGAPQDAAPRAFLEGPALVIDGEVVSWAEYGSYLVREHGAKQASAFANHIAIERAAREAGIVLGTEELDERALAEIDRRVRGAFAGDRDAWLAELAGLGTTEAHWMVVRRAELRDELRLERLVKARRVIRDEDVHALWEQRHGPGGRSIRVHALRLQYAVPSSEGTTDVEERKRRERAVQEDLLSRLGTLRSRVLSGEDFDTLARSAGEDAEAAAGGGAWSEPFRWELWPAEVRDALRSLPVGGVSAPLYGRGCFNLFRVVSEEFTPFEPIADLLREELRDRPVGGEESGPFLTSLAVPGGVVVLPELSSESLDPAPSVLRIGEEEFSRGEVLAWLAPLIASREALPFVRLHLCERELSRRGLAVSPEQVLARVQQEIEDLVERVHGGDFARWHDELTKRGMDEARMRRNLAVSARLDLSAETILRSMRTVTDADVRALHEERFGPDGRRLDLRVLRASIRLPPESQRASAAEREEMRHAAHDACEKELRRLRERALAEGEDFGALARANSDEPESRDLGGRYAGGFPWERFAPEVRKELRALQPGEIAGPLEVGDALWLFELAGADSVPLASVQDELRAELASRAPTALECGHYLDELVTSCTWSLDLSAFGG